MSRARPPVSQGSPPDQPWLAMPLSPDLEEGVFRSCTLEPYTHRPIENVPVGGEFIAYASPDSTYAVTKQLFDGAKRSILIGIYDFTAEYMRDLLRDAIDRGVKVTLMLDIDSPEEQTIFDALHGAGARTVEAPSCASKHIQVFRSSHEKVIVIDETWTLVQSGNYSKASIPENPVDGGGSGQFALGNRDMGLAVRSPELARFFATLLEADMKIELDAEAAEALEVSPTRLSALVMAEKATTPPAKLFKSLRFTPAAPITVRPILTPENYVGEVGAWLAKAKRSIWIENQYIKTDHTQITKLLGNINQARKRNPKLDVRIILAKGFDGGVAVGAAFAALRSRYQLRVGTHLRILNPKHFDHLHNKLIIVDGTTVLVSSQNWSNSAVVENREAGLLLESPELAGYYGGIFQSDWDDALTKVPPRRTREEGVPLPVGPATRGDYAEV